MKAAGIIAEFDPFHNGHRYILNQMRERGATHIAVIMSGSAVQRGTPAFCDKYFRAETAVRYGADLVIEMPAPYSCSNAEVFARTGVRALSSLGEGLIECLYFGSETDDTGLIIRAAEASQSLKDSPLVKKFLAEGTSYPAAIGRACETEYGSETASVLSNPNSTLAVEYCKAISSLAPWIKPCAILRKGAAHNSSEVSGETASATKIREMIMNGEDISRFVPCSPGGYCGTSKIDSIFLYKLLSAERTDLMMLPDGDRAICDRFLKAAETCPASTEEFLLACKSKNFTAARLRRMALHLVLDITKDDIIPIPYLRVLAFNSRGAKMLKAADSKLPLGTSLAELERSSDDARRIISIEKRASLLRLLGTDTGKPVNEYKRQIKITQTES